MTTEHPVLADVGELVERLTAASNRLWTRGYIQEEGLISPLLTEAASHLTALQAALLGAEGKLAWADEVALSEAELEHACKDLDLQIEDLQAENARLRAGLEGSRETIGPADIRWEEIANGSPFTHIDRLLLGDMYRAARSLLDGGKGEEAGS